MDQLAIFLCSYLKDLHRVVRLCRSIDQYNVDRLPLHIAVPAAHLPEFRRALPGSTIRWLTQEEVFASTPSSKNSRYETVSGGHMQQVVKSEAWRLGIAENLLVMDSDCKFIRPFCARDFIAANGDPYCVMGDARQVQELSEQLRMPKIWTDWLAVSDTTRNYFRNSSPTRHSYGGAPFIWSSKVWSDLATQRLEPAGETFLDLVRQLGSELVIYGEALIAFKSISIQPHGPFFKLYLYEEEAWIDRALGIDESILAGTRMGVVNQSNWEYWTDHRRYRKSIPSRVARSLRRQIAFVRWRLQFRKSNAQRSHDSQFPSIDGVQ